MREQQLARASRDFHRQRERLEARFMSLAGRSGKPRGLEWVRCDFEDDVIYARHRQSGELSAFVSVTIGFEAIEGGGMEEVEAVGNLRRLRPYFAWNEEPGLPTAAPCSTSPRPKPWLSTKTTSNSSPTN